MQGERSTPDPSAASPLGVLRRVWAAEASGQSVDLRGLGLGEADLQTVELGVELLRFAQAIDIGVTYFLLELNVGPALNTVQLRGYGQTVANRIAEVAAGRQGALESLRRALERNRKFLLDLNEAYRKAIPEGVLNLLRPLSPRDAAMRHRRFLGLFGASAALEDLGTVHADLAAAPPEDLLQRFFVEPFQRELAQRLGLETR